MNTMYVLQQHFVLCVAAALMCRACNCVATHNAQFAIYSALENTTCTDHADFVGVVGSALACSALCDVSGAANCRGFFFNRGTGYCTLVNIITVPATGCSQEEGSKYYKRCFEGDVGRYTGTLSWGKSGVRCQRWDSNSPHSHDQCSRDNFPVNETCITAHNYCRRLTTFERVHFCESAHTNINQREGDCNYESNCYAFRRLLRFM